MRKYPIKLLNKDFEVLEANYNAKGKRKKDLVVDRHGDYAFFKYQGEGYNVSESCSEKLCYELAKVLGYDCARIELAKDESGNLGVLNYLFVRPNSVEHSDAIAYLNIHYKDRSKFYTISNIKATLDKIDKSLFNDFLKIMLFDALVGEQDRHEENWGVKKINGKYMISPLYDNGCSLLKEFKDEKFAEKYYNGEKNFGAYIRRSKVIIYKEDNSRAYKHFELIEYLNKDYHDVLNHEINNLQKLTNKTILNIVNKIPNDLLTCKHKEKIIEYLEKRRDILINIIRGDKNE